jgi:hypothetical protein
MLKWPSARGRFSKEIRLMDDVVIDTHLENLDRRLAKVEQILPTLATKKELRDAIAPLATKDELAAAIALLATKAELAAAIAPLATKEEMRLEIREEGERSRRHMDIIGEALRADIQLLAEHVASLIPRPRMD